ncbi:hypothetical protein ACFWTE_16700 [Nocardiopsis sp. NPDC058631]|uniref:hypothetical protein n=1 Tax=Nocardiopsis sp. NPDC058631 TaxID=3346566 RepID=UPI00365BD104
MIWLSGNTAGIGPLRADLKESYWCWENTIPTIVGYNRQTPQPFEIGRLFYDSYENSSDRQLKFTIYDLAEKTPPPSLRRPGLRGPDAPQRRVRHRPGGSSLCVRLAGDNLSPIAQACREINVNASCTWERLSSARRTWPR